MNSTEALPKFVIKRDGSVKDFDITKIANALAKAGKATGEFDDATANRITHIEVVRHLQKNDLTTPTIEQIQDAVENALLRTWLIGRITIALVLLLLLLSFPPAVTEAAASALPGYW